MAYAKFSDLIGQTITHIKGCAHDNEMIFTLDDGRQYIMHHHQDCCETVGIEEIHGDLDDLIGSPILLAEEVESDGDGAAVPDEILRMRAKAALLGESIGGGENGLWTFYKLATIKSHVTIRWYGESDYYSVSVSFDLITN